MPERDGYKTFDLVIEEVGAPENRVRVAIAALDIQTRTFATDRRHRYYSQEDVERIKEWIRTH